MSNFSSAIRKLESRGVKLIPKGDNLRLEGNTDALTREQIEWLKAHKAQLLAELKSANQSSPASRLRSLAPKYHLDPDALQDWYKNDDDLISCMDDKTLDALVRDYAANREAFHGNKPFSAYRLWTYKINPGDPGYVRQGLMTADKEEAANMLQKIYGKPVHGLHLLVTIYQV